MLNRKVVKERGFMMIAGKKVNVAAISYPVVVNNRVYSVRYMDGMQDSAISYDVQYKCMAEMSIANLMGLRVSEARELWAAIGVPGYETVA